MPHYYNAVYSVYSVQTKEVLYIGTTKKQMAESLKTSVKFSEDWREVSTLSLILRHYHKTGHQLCWRILFDADWNCDSQDILDTKNSFIRELNPIGNLSDYKKLLYRERNTRTLVRRCIEIILSLEAETEEQTKKRIKHNLPVVNIFTPSKEYRKSTYKPIKK